MANLKVSVILLSACVASVLCSEGWDYILGSGIGPYSWKDNYESCGGQRQSPINVDTASVLYDPALTRLRLEGYDEVPTGVTFETINNGHSATVNLVGSQMTMSGGNLPGVYDLVQFHFHWGTEDTQGSEHTINGNKYPAEVHLVHVSDKYTAVTDALKNADGLAVLGFMIEVGAVENEAFEELTDKLMDIKYKDETVELTPFAIRDILPGDVDSYFRYPGSLTTPGCAEAVTWTLLEDKVYLSRRQIAKFRMLFVDEREVNNTSELHHIENNFRPTQPLYGRTITTSIFTSGAVTATTGVLTLFCLVLNAFVKL